MGDEAAPGAPVPGAKVTEAPRRTRHASPSAPVVSPALGNNWPAPAATQRPATLAPPAPASTRPAPSPIVVTHERVVAPDTAEALYEAYVDNVGPLAELAVLRHVDTRGEMLAQFANPRILKLIAWQANVPVGLAMLTNSLEDVAEISPPFLRNRYPQQAARDAIYICMLVIVVKAERGLTVFSRLYTEMWQVPALDAGVLVFDVCEFNRTLFAADVSAQRVADMFPRSTFGVLDRQTWYVAELPEPLPGTVPAR